MQSSRAFHETPDDDEVPVSADLWRHRHGPPDNEIPIGLPVTEVLGRGDGVALALVGVRVYSDGIELDLALRLRQGSADHHDLYRSFMDGASHGGGSGDRFLFGIEFADGRHVSNVHGEPGPEAGPEPGPEAEAEPAAVGRQLSAAQPSLIGAGGHGGGRSFDQTLWVSPRPPAGPLTLVCAWLGVGIPETAVVLDGTAMTEAAGRVEELWPWEPERYEPEPATVPDLPPGWFADRAGSRRGGPTG